MNRMRLIYYSFVIFFTALMTTAIANAQSVIVPSANLDIIVDLDLCDSGGQVLCGGTGSVGAAADGNDSIVAVYIQVKHANGTPIGGLTEGDFTTTAIANPPPGVTPTFVSTAVCAACFAEQTTGVYRLALRPSSGNWGAGTYVVLVEVTGPGGIMRQLLVPLDIAS